MPITLDIHVLQTLPPSCINRDDLGSPKSAEFGGTRRLRVSSQAWKRAARMQSLQAEEAERAVRTRYAFSTVANLIGTPDETTEKEIHNFVDDVISSLGFKEGKGDKDAILLFASNKELADLSDVLRPHAASYSKLSAAKKKALLKNGSDLHNEIDQVFAGTQCRDVALYGRMVANRPGWGVEAGMRVAHAISVDAVATQHDYFTGVDDLLPDGDTGAGMIGNIEFSAGTLYRYASINLDQLTRNAGGDPHRAIDYAIEGAKSFVTSMPTGRQTSMAATTLPDLVLITVRDGQGISLAHAFEEATPSRGEGSVLSRATTRLANSLEDLSLWGGADLYRGATHTRRAQAATNTFGAPLAFDTLLEEAATALKEAAK